MSEKVILITVDGMRSDGFLQCGNPFIDDMMKRSTYGLKGVNVLPTDTLPCHMSLFTGTTPEIHNTRSNTFREAVQYVKGLVEQIHDHGGKTAMYYGWEEMQDVVRPGGLDHSEYFPSHGAGYTDAAITRLAIDYIKKESPDFLFLHLDGTDCTGHHIGWMTKEYLSTVSDAVDCVKTVLCELGDEYSVVVTSDHGGVGTDHGGESPEEMTIPVFFFGPDFGGGREIGEFSIMDIAPTVTKTMGVPTPDCWLGKSVI